MTELSAQLLATLYSADLADFLAVRKELAEQAREAGDTALARAITSQRKPTTAAWIVNRHVHADASAVGRLVELGAQLRAAHEQLDASAMRELSTLRRQLVTELSTAALADADRAAAGAALRDDVFDTFDAAVADPRVAAQLGHVTRSEKWSGFGVGADAPDAQAASGSAPELTVIRGGRDRPVGKTAVPKATARKATGKTATRKTATGKTATGKTATGKKSGLTDTAVRATKAARLLSAAEAALQSCTDAERSAAQRVQELVDQLERVGKELSAAKREHDRSRKELRSTRNREHEARAAFDRVQQRTGGSPDSSK